jgi:hypothetical protein
MNKFYISYFCYYYSACRLGTNDNNPKSNHGNKFEQLGTMLSTTRTSTARHQVHRGQNIGSKKPITI